MVHSRVHGASAHRLFRLSVLALSCALTVPAMAAENGLQRYSPGVGGSDMTSPLVPGSYFQLPLVAYHASKIMGADGKQATAATPATGLDSNLRSQVSIKTDTYALLPRYSYLSAHRWLGANVGWTVMLPVIKRKATFTGTPIYAGSTVPSLYQPTVTAGINAKFDALNGSVDGLGDLEVSPLLHWEIGDHQQVTVAPTIVLPTGDYDATRRVNTGYGNFFTFRPSVQYAYIGDGWDVGGRAVLSFNTRNKDNGYYSGNMFNFDWQLMAFVSEDIRLGVQGYFVRQLNNDTQDLSGFSSTQQSSLQKEIIDGNKTSVNAVGPAVAWLRNGGEFLLEGKFMKEFDARNRTEGQAFWLTLSKPL
jgi:hypothetical protein